jgi:hypothetical protein
MKLGSILVCYRQELPSTCWCLLGAIGWPAHHS